MAADREPRDARATRDVLLARARRFFADGGVLEVDTPMVVNAPVSDVNIHSALVDLGAPLTGAVQTARFRLCGGQASILPPHLARVRDEAPPRRRQR